ncbi:hypothetical protein [Marivita sp. XM-24bin2]|jgi:hypothetical protein|uniref:hypothetical protein n=1 Tax=unclassified Marivita TaxID=2632480 RepID=UPI000D79EF4E|nr:hypothetical protein [Marivita sp. XM-24bin2]MCR9109519.1 hypothetical protein [Paracoccaceae bacterium]PWL35314.1 MAG: hypothetical protein DCO97_09960 [Marivita sp. XM-24bin2]
MIEFKPEMSTYLRAHAVMTAIAMAAGMLILWVLGNPHIWTGAVGGFAAVALRGWYLADEVMDEVWTMSSVGLKGPYGRTARFEDISKLRTIAGAVQIVTKSGDKHLIKYQPDPNAVIAQINAARQKKAA